MSFLRPNRAADYPALVESRRLANVIIRIAPDQASDPDALARALKQLKRGTPGVIRVKDGPCTPTRGRACAGARSPRTPASAK